MPKLKDFKKGVPQDFEAILNEGSKGLAGVLKHLSEFNETQAKAGILFSNVKIGTAVNPEDELSDVDILAFIQANKADIAGLPAGTKKNRLRLLLGTYKADLQKKMDRLLALAPPVAIPPELTAHHNAIKDVDFNTVEVPEMLALIGTLFTPQFIAMVKAKSVPTKASEPNPVGGSITLVKRARKKKVDEIDSDNRYAKIAGKGSPQDKRVAKGFHTAPTNFPTFYTNISDKFTRLGTGKASPDPLDTADKVRAYVNSKLQSRVEGKGVVVSVEVAAGKREDILRIETDKLICTTNLIPILDPEERARLTGVGDEAIKAAAPSIADGFRAMIENAGDEYDVKFAIVNLLDAAGKEVNPRTANFKDSIEDGKLLVDLARNALIAGAVPILGKKQLDSIRHLSLHGTDQYKTYAENILKIDTLVYGAGSARVEYGDVEDTAAAAGIAKFKELFDINKPRVKITKATGVPPISFADIVYEVTDARTRKKTTVVPRATDVAAGKILVDLAADALNKGAIPNLTVEQVACIQHFSTAAGVDPVVQAEAKKVLQVDALVFGTGASRKKQADVEESNIERGMAKRTELFGEPAVPPRLGSTGKGLTPSLSRTGGALELSAAEKNEISQALTAIRGASFPELGDAGLEQIINNTVRTFNSKLTEPTVTSANRAGVIAKCCEDAGIPPISTATAVPPKPPVIPVEEEVEPAARNLEHKIDKVKYARMIKMGLEGAAVNELKNFGLFHKGNLDALKEICGTKSDEILGVDGANLPDETPKHKKLAF